MHQDVPSIELAVQRERIDVLGHALEVERSERRALALEQFYRLETPVRRAAAAAKRERLQRDVRAVRLAPRAIRHRARAGAQSLQQLELFAAGTRQGRPDVDVVVREAARARARARASTSSRPGRFERAGARRGRGEGRRASHEARSGAKRARRGEFTII